MKKTILFAGMFASIFMFYGCGQELNLTVYNDTGILPTSETYCAARVEWEGGTQSHTFSGTGTDISASNSFTVQIKEGSEATVYGYGYYYEEDSGGRTTVASYLQTGVQSVYGGYLEAPNWYACLYMDKVLIYKK
jgi:hypothetical protein